jgi:hypothetical protein
LTHSSAWISAVVVSVAITIDQGLLIQSAGPNAQNRMMAATITGCT